VFQEDTVKQMTYTLVNRIFSENLVLMVAFSNHEEKLTLKEHGENIYSVIVSKYKYIVQDCTHVLVGRNNSTSCNKWRKRTILERAQCG